MYLIKVNSTATLEIIYRQTSVIQTYNVMMNCISPDGPSVSVFQYEATFEWQRLPSVAINIVINLQNNVISLVMNMQNVNYS